MKHQWLAYVIVGLLSIGAGVAIAGLPDNVPVDATIVAPTTDVDPEPTLPETTVATTTVPPTTEPETTEPETAKATTTVAPTTTVPDTTAPDTTDSGSTQLPDRGELNVAAANVANVAGAAARMVTTLEEIGYVDIVPLDGTGIVEFTTIYYADGFEEAADRLALDLDLLPFFVSPLEVAPSVDNLPADVELLVYIGVDRA